MLIALEWFNLLLNLLAILAIFALMGLAIAALLKYLQTPPRSNGDLP
jgi:hypothetical protein